MTKKNKSKIIAAVCIGCNAIEMKIVQITKNNKVKILETLCHPITLGKDIFSTGNIGFETADTICDILKNFKKLLIEYEVKIYKVSAANIIDEAQNKDYILDRIKMKTGLRVKVIDGAVERFYMYRLVRKMIENEEQLEDGGALVAGIGCANIELTICKADNILFSEELKLGALRIKQELAGLENHTLDFVEIYEDYITENIDMIKAFQSEDGITNFIALDGVMNIIAKLCDCSNLNKELIYISKEKFMNLYDELTKETQCGLEKDYDISTEIEEVLLPYVIILNKLLNNTEAEGIYVPTVSLVDGIISNIAKKQFNINKERDIKDIVSSAVFTAKKYNNDFMHSGQVESKSLILFDVLKKIHRLGDRERLLLQLSSILHDTGKFMDITSHHIHSYNIVMASDLIGISKKEREIIANVVRYHGSDVPSDNDDNYKKLPVSSKVVVSKLTSILRISDSLDRSHKQKIQDIDVSINGDEILIKANTKEDILLEQWIFNKKSQLFKEIFGKIPVLKAERKMNSGQVEIQ